MCYFNDKHHETMVLQLTNDPGIPNPVAPQLAKRGALQGFASLSRVLQRGNARLQKSYDPFRLSGPYF